MCCTQKGAPVITAQALAWESKEKRKLLVVIASDWAVITEELPGLNYVTGKG
jgi:hypothetical protein